MGYLIGFACSTLKNLLRTLTDSRVPNDTLLLVL